jgi:hypothetical protein
VSSRIARGTSTVSQCKARIADRRRRCAQSDLAQGRRVRIASDQMRVAALEEPQGSGARRSTEAAVERRRRELDQRTRFD